jgi:hypothetical protein
VDLLQSALREVGTGAFNYIGAALVAGLLGVGAAIRRGWLRPAGAPTTTRVYLSSTLDDLADQRSVIRRALARMPVVCLGDGPAGPRATIAERRELVRDCDLYLGVFAWRYGDVPAGENVSITELEYREAVSQGRRRLILLLPEGRPWLPEHVDRGDDQQRIEALRATLRATETCRDLPASPTALAALVKAEVAASLPEVSVASRVRDHAADVPALALAVTVGGFGALVQALDQGGAGAVWMTALVAFGITYAVRLALATSGWQLARPARSRP